MQEREERLNAERAFLQYHWQQEPWRAVQLWVMPCSAHPVGWSQAFCSMVARHMQDKDEDLLPSSPSCHLAGSVPRALQQLLFGCL